MKVIAIISSVAAGIGYYVHSTNYGASGLWLDWNPDAGVLVNGAVNILMGGGCFVAAWLLIAAIDKMVENFLPEVVAIQWRRLVG